MPALLSLLLGASPVAVAVLPVEAPELPPEASRSAAEALVRALPAPFAPMALDGATVREHLAAAGPACRTDLACLCRAAGLAPDQLALDLSIVPEGQGHFWATDLRLLAPCGGGIVDRRAEMLPAGALRAFLESAVAEMLRGRDLAERAEPAAPSRFVSPAPAASVPSSRHPAAEVPAPAAAPPSGEAPFAPLLREGRARLAAEQYAKALEKLDAAVALRPGAYDALVARGHARLGLAAFDAAIADYEAAHRAEPGRAMALLGLAEANARMGRPAEALRWYRAALGAPLDDLPEGTRARAQQKADALAAEGTR